MWGLPMASSTWPTQCSGATFSWPLMWYFTRSAKNSPLGSLSR